MKEALIILLGLIPVVLFVTLMRYFYRSLRHPKKIVTESNGLRKISTPPSLFGLFASRTLYYYDEQFFYQIKQKEKVTLKVPLAKIVRVKPGYTMVNNRRSWVVTWQSDGGEKQVSFYHNITLFNHNFAVFLHAIKEANPQAEIKELTSFTL
ncbi:hypothetical protein [Kosakonia sp. SMBL-WEM22]|uniref:hypothetical protein n=1 Tax=Kosakonia sp. SMBL-WEM22 TaxID=2725560 RepID=UPI001CB92FE6|nr:hypothetical protein [Kosakonia sp. SMBL-WEM22]MDV5357524.1 hypothetical protein [Enterobacter asburiae]